MEQTPVIQVFGSVFGDEELDIVRESIENAWLGMGPRVKEFEGELGERLDAEVVMVNSGSSALYLATELLDLPPSSDVVLPAFTWVACVHAIALAGHRPVFADIDPDTHSMEAAQVERAMTDRTAAVMVVHYAGKPVRMEAIDSLGLPVVEDAAHAVDSKLGDRPCGALGTVGILSFDGVKNIATPDGGAVVTRDPAVAEVARRLRYCGIGRAGFERRGDGRWWEMTIARPFQRLLPNDVAAGIGLVQLGRLEENQARRREIWEAYSRALADLTWLELPPGPAPDERHSYFTYLIRVLDGRRDALAEMLLAEHVYTTLRYQPLHLIEPYRNGARLPVTEQFAAHGLNLPLHPRLTDADVERIISLIAEF